VEVFNVKRVGQLFLVAAMLCGSVGYAGAARAANEYSFTLETKGDAATFDISSPENATIRVIETVPKDSKRERLVTGGVGYYSIVIMLCGKKYNHRWNRVGQGVTITTGGCDGGISFTYKR
jgi:hypothetical protein